MKRFILLSFTGAFLLTLSGLDLAWGRGHVPIHKTQVCQERDNGTTEVRTI